MTERFNSSLINGTPLKKLVELGWRAQLRKDIRDPELRAKLKPDYPFGCKRVLFSNDWYSTLAQHNVDVVTEPVVEVLPEGVRSGDDQVHEVDVIIYGTGFAATEFLAPIQVTGVDGADLQARWKTGARAYLGLCMPDFPNLFVVYGPNTNLGGSSVINMLEAASGAITTLLQHTESQSARSIVVRPDVEERYDEEIQKRLNSSVWASCHNWYHEDGGRISTNWPGLVAEYQRRCASIDPADFVTA